MNEHIHAWMREVCPELCVKRWVNSRFVGYQRLDEWRRASVVEYECEMKDGTSRTLWKVYPPARYDWQSGRYEYDDWERVVGSYLSVKPPIDIPAEC